MTEYMQFLRSYVGHAPLLQVGASVILENEDGEILLQLRKDNHCWSYQGGSVDTGESVEATAKRELYEETGLVADSIELFGVFSGEELHYTYPNGDEVYNIDIVYICNKYHGTIKAQEDEVEMLKFYNINDLPKNISPPNIPVLKSYLQKRMDSKIEKQNGYRETINSSKTK